MKPVHSEPTTVGSHALYVVRKSIKWRGVLASWKSYRSTMHHDPPAHRPVNSSRIGMAPPSGYWWSFLLKVVPCHCSGDTSLQPEIFLDSVGTFTVVLLEATQPFWFDTVTCSVTVPLAGAV